MYLVILVSVTPVDFDTFKKIYEQRIFATSKVCNSAAI